MIVKAIKSNNMHNLSEFLFWDIDKSKINAKRNKRWLINRVIEYGRLSDWLYIVNIYGMNEIVKVASTLRDIDKKTVTFLSAITNVPKDSFLCCNTKQLNQPHWNF